MQTYKHKWSSPDKSIKVGILGLKLFKYIALEYTTHIWDFRAQTTLSDATNVHLESISNKKKTLEKKNWHDYKAINTENITRAIIFIKSNELSKSYLPVI